MGIAGSDALRAASAADCTSAGALPCCADTAAPCSAPATSGPGGGGMNAGHEPLTRGYAGGPLHLRPQRADSGRWDGRPGMGGVGGRPPGMVRRGGSTVAENRINSLSQNGRRVIVVGKRAQQLRRTIGVGHLAQHSTLNETLQLNRLHCSTQHVNLGSGSLTVRPRENHSGKAVMRDCQLGCAER